VNIETLHEELIKKKIPPSWYMLTDKGISDLKTCIRFIDNKWCVYFSERGMKFRLQMYETESEACNELLSRMIQQKNKKH